MVHFVEGTSHPIRFEHKFSDEPFIRGEYSC